MRRSLILLSNRDYAGLKINGLLYYYIGGGVCGGSLSQYFVQTTLNGSSREMVVGVKCVDCLNLN